MLELLLKWAVLSITILFEYWFIVLILLFVIITVYFRFKGYGYFWTANLNKVDNSYPLSKRYAINAACIGTLPFLVLIFISALLFNSKPHLIDLLWSLAFYFLIILPFLFAGIGYLYGKKVETRFKK